MITNIVVSYLRKDFKPNYIAMRDTEGRSVPLKNRDATIATYLESEHWMNDVGLEPLQHLDHKRAQFNATKHLSTFKSLRKYSKQRSLASRLDLTT